MLNLTLGLKREPPLVRTISVVRGEGSRAHGWEWQCTALTLRLDQGSAEPRQTTARPRHGWRGSGSGNSGNCGAQGGSAVGAHGNGGSGLGREQGESRLGQGKADAGPAVGGIAGAGRDYWGHTARDLGSTDGSVGLWLHARC